MNLWDSVPKQWSRHGLGAPSFDVLLRADRMLRRRYHLEVADRQDVIAEALLDYVCVVGESGRARTASLLSLCDDGPATSGVAEVAKKQP